MSWKSAGTWLTIVGLSLLDLACSSDSDSNTPAAFTLTSPSYKSGGEIPDEFTCEGKPFGEGISPELHWSAGPAKTKSYALLFKDTTLTTLDPPNVNGYHWAIWNIPASTHSLPEALGADQFPASPAGSEQYSGYPARPFQFLGPCPSWAATKSGDDADRSEDTYSFTLYALDTDPLVLPVYDADENYAKPLDDYFDSIQIGKAELIGTSDAKPSEVPF